MRSVIGVHRKERSVLVNESGGGWGKVEVCCGEALRLQFKWLFILVKDYKDYPLQCHDTI